jgi:RNA polymerase sigma-70 factor (ECF subfamily)
VHVRASEDQLREWMVAGLDGDAKAYSCLLSALVPSLRSFFARRLGGASDDVEDLVQDCLMAIHTRRATYDRARPFMAWTYGVARYKMIDHFRQTRHHVTIDDLEDILVAEGFEDACTARMDVTKLLGELPPKQARAIRDTRIGGMSVAESAEARGWSEADVKVSVHRGLKALAARLKDVM